MSGDAKATHKAACERLGAAQAKEWREDVTHLVTPMMQWTPKFLYALGSLVPVVNPLWLHDASMRTAISDPLPDVNDAKYAPTPPAGARAESGLDARVGCVHSARARLLSGVRLLCLPPTAPHPDSLKLIALMGGEAVPWDGPALDGPDAAAHATITLAQAKELFESATAPTGGSGAGGGSAGGHQHDLEVPPGF